MSENTINTGFFGNGSNVPKGLQAVVATAMSGGNIECKKKSSPTTNGGTQQVIYVVASRIINNIKRPLMLTLTDLSSNTNMKINAELRSLGIGEVYDKIFGVTTDEEVYDYLHGKLEGYLTNFDPNKLAEFKKQFIATPIDNLVDYLKQANFDAEVVNKIKAANSAYLGFNKKKQVVNGDNAEDKAVQAEGSAS